MDPAKCNKCRLENNDKFNIKYAYRAETYLNIQSFAAMFEV